MSPFYDLGRRCGGPLPAGRTSRVPSAGPPPSAPGRAFAEAGSQGISLRRFAWLLALGVLGLAGLLSLGVGGIARFRVDVSPAAPVQKSESVVTR